MTNHDSKTNPIRGRPILFIPGMNNSPNVASALTRELENRGFITTNLTLARHFGIASPITPGEWKRSVLSAVSELEAPTTIVAYSLGALALLEALEELPASKIDRIILLAPPLQLRAWVSVTGAIARLFPRTWCVPSMTPRQHRLYRCVPLSWYEESARMASVLLDNQSAARSSLPVTVILSSGDEAIDSGSTASWIETNHPTWKVITIQPQSELPDTYNHLLPDPRSMGPAAWSRIIELIAENP